MPPDVGELHWADLDGYRGPEKGGRQPVLTVSERFYNQRSRRVVVCPLPTRAREGKTDVALPANCPVSGVILTDQIRALHRELRLFDFIATLPRAQMLTVRHVLDLIPGLHGLPAGET